MLTRLPGPVRPTPDQALQLVRRVQGVFDVLSLEPTVYDEALQRCMDRGFSSGVVFDALHLIAAERAGAEALVTFNGADFRRLTLPTSPRVEIPPDPPDVAL